MVFAPCGHVRHNSWLPFTILWPTMTINTKSTLHYLILQRRLRQCPMITCYIRSNIIELMVISTPGSSHSWRADPRALLWRATDPAQPLSHPEYPRAPCWDPCCSCYISMTYREMYSPKSTYSQTTVSYTQSSTQQLTNIYFSKTSKHWNSGATGGACGSMPANARSWESVAHLNPSTASPCTNSE